MEVVQPCNCEMNFVIGIRCKMKQMFSIHTGEIEEEGA